MSKRLVIALIVWAARAGIVQAADPAAADVKGSHDHPLLPRFANSRIIKFDEKAFDARDLIVEPVEQSGERGTLHVEGKATLIAYKAPADASIIQLFRNYETALKDAGFETLYRCSGDRCGKAFRRTVVPFGQISDQGTIVPFGGEHPEYVAAKLGRAEGDVYAMVYVNDSPGMGSAPYVVLRVVEERPMQQTMVKVDAVEMARGIAKGGHIALYGIYFDTDKADLKPESKDTLDEMANLLRADPGLTLYVVGHTDNQGTAEYNLELSQRRARAVVAELSSKYGVEARRLTPYGVGLYSPVASNDSEQGRAQNRRVELVKR